MSLLLSIVVHAVLISGAPHNDYGLYFAAESQDFETVLNEADFVRAKAVPVDEQLPAENPLTKSGKFEGDIDGIDAETFAANQLQRNAIKFDSMKWPDGTIPYMISSRFSSYSRARIAAAMEEFSQKTCVKFVPRKSERDYVYLTPDQGCYSMVGKLGGRQIVSLGYGCIHKGIIMHELMHVTGFFHEQSRADRDDFVNVLWHNVMPDMRGQFQKFLLDEIQYLGTVYDYGSIMHYGPTDFSRNGLPTLQPIQPSVQIGQRHGFSSLDQLKINRLYNCQNQMQSTPPPTVIMPPRSIHFTTPFKQTTPVMPVPTPQPTNELCLDKLNKCPQLTADGHCHTAKEWMSAWCPLSCGRCNAELDEHPSEDCVDANSFCSLWSSKGYCNDPSFDKFMTIDCRKSCGFC